MINKELYFNELDELLMKNSNLDRTDFELLYEVLESKNITTDTAFLADKIVKSLSGGVFTHTMISWEFLSSEIGRALLKAKFDIANNIYFSSDLADILNCSRQFITKIIKNGDIKYQKRGGIIYFMESDVREYLLQKKKINLINEKKEITYNEAKEKFICGNFERESEYK